MRNKNEINKNSVQQSNNVKLAESGLVNETMRDYLSNLSNFVIDSVNKNVISEDETETSIQETVTVEFKNKNGLFNYYI